MHARLEQLYEIRHGQHQTVVPMEGLRGFAVFLVFIVHYTTLVTPWISDMTWLSAFAGFVRAMGNAGVDLFFVISGFLIYGSLIRGRQAFGVYLRRRIERIYPTFLVVFAVYLVLSFVLPQGSKIPDDASWALLYVIANFFLLPGIFPIQPIITVAWSLSYEMMFYICMPLIVGGLRLVRWERRYRIALFIVAASLMIILPQSVGGRIRLSMFLSGLLLYEMANRSYGYKIDMLGLLFLAGGLTIYAWIKSPGFGEQWQNGILFISFFFLCLACFNTDGLCRRIFSWTPMRWLGNISYSYYLIHGLTLKLLFLFLDRIWFPEGSDAMLFWVMLPLSFALTFAVATLLFTYVEKPYSLAPTLRRNHKPLLGGSS